MNATRIAAKNLEKKDFLKYYSIRNTNDNSKLETLLGNTNDNS